MIGILASGHSSWKLFSKVSTWGHEGSNDTGLNSVSGPGADCIECHTNRNFWILYNNIPVDYYYLFPKQLCLVFFIIYFQLISIITSTFNVKSNLQTLEAKQEEIIERLSMLEDNQKVRLCNRIAKIC